MYIKQLFIILFLIIILLLFLIITYGVVFYLLKQIRNLKEYLRVYSMQNNLGLLFKLLGYEKSIDYSKYINYHDLLKDKESNNVKMIVEENKILEFFNKNYKDSINAKYTYSSFIKKSYIFITILFLLIIFGGAFYIQYNL